MTERSLKRLTKKELSGYREDGYITVSGLFTEDELKEISQEYDDLFERKKAENGRLEAKWAGDWEKENSVGSTPSAPKSSAGSVLSIHNLQNHSAVFTRIITNPGLLDCFEDIIGDGVVLHHTKAHLKPAKEGTAFPSHQDYHYFPYRDDSMLAAFIHLEDTSKENGGLAVFPGSHKLGGQENVSTTPGVYYLNQKEWNLDSGMEVSAKAGDVVIFSYLLVHASYPNTSNIPRRMFLLQVAGSNDRSLSDQHKSPGAGLVLRGRSFDTIADLDMRHMDKK